MKAIVCTKYGSPDVLQFQEVDTPAPKDDEVLIRVHAASVNSRDLRRMRANPPFIRLMKGGLLRPSQPILGADMAGHVETVGASVRQFKPGDAVFGYLSRYGGKTLAEYVCAGEDEIALKPANLSFEQAAAAPLAAITALQGLRDKGNIQPGQRVAIQGASGGVGTFAVQIAKAFGAEVTGVCSTKNLDMVRALGADYVVDYTQEDFTRNGRQYDLILAVNGAHPIRDYLRALTPAGTLVIVGGAMSQLFQAGLRGRRNAQSGGQKVTILTLVDGRKDLGLVKEFLEAGKLMPVIDACYPLSETADAFRYFEEVHAQGKVVITTV